MDVNKQVRWRNALIPGMYTEFLPPSLRTKARIRFVYGGEILPVAAGTTVTNNIAIEADSHFLITSAEASFRTDAAPPVVVATPAVLVEFRDNGSGRFAQNTQLDQLNYFGTGTLPNIFAYPFLVKRSSNIATRFTNNEAIDIQVRYQYAGIKIFPNVEAVDEAHYWLD